ncbi:dual specificity mitogen-activated protein kinase kinase 7 [Tetranychus urticae]|uniref:mitogen-activated protein kinase kinase n=1 Tax=Tetranychus urticae TaxID=32264 RepID=T1JXF7_TETUR|nr:dual specificity mitogen-activated protein kinase kinase 7 [Tetranychus urticae]
MQSLKSVSQKLMRLDLQVRKENECHRLENDTYMAAHCLSPRPRPRALPIDSNYFGANGRASGRTSSPSGRPMKQPKPLLFTSDPSTPLNISASSGSENKPNLSDRFTRNCTLQVNGKTYKCEMEDLEFICDLGFGSCGQVTEMKHKESGITVAVKQMRRSGNDEETKRIAMDLDVLLKCSSCKYIVQCYGYLICNSEVWICMERMTTCFEKLLKKLNPQTNETNSKKKKKGIPQDVLGKVAVATVKALDYLKEKHDVIHRDVKPSNILINMKGEVKLCDFGISGKLVNSKARTRQAGCAAYMAPERIEPPEPSYDVRADIWSLGITLLELATGENPYPGCQTDFEVLTKVMTAPPPRLPEDGDFMPQLRQFINSCLIKNFKERPKYKELLASDYIKYFDEKEVNITPWLESVYEEDNKK